MFSCIICFSTHPPKIICRVFFLTYFYFYKQLFFLGFPGGASGKEPICQCRRCRRFEFNPWVRKSPCRRGQQPTPVFLPGDPIDRGPWRATVHRIAKRHAWSDFSMQSCLHTVLSIHRVLGYITRQKSCLKILSSVLLDIAQLNQFPLLPAYMRAPVYSILMYPWNYQL